MPRKAVNSLNSDDDLPPIVQRRQASRRRMLFPGKIVHRNGAQSFGCTIRDISTSGARISVSQGEVVPKHAYLIDIRNGVAHEVVVIWIRPPSFGLKFLNTYQLSDLTNQDLQFLKDIWVQLGVR
jgi:hypothetical protein